MEPARLCVVFEDRHILSKSQKSEGLKQSWLLLKPQHETISDLSSYLTHIFDLHHSCPNGIILSMDGFVLPPFESTCILKDKDVIRVKRKGEMFSEIVDKSDGANLIEEEEIVEKQPVLAVVPLLANEEFEKETGRYQSEPEEDEHNLSGDTLFVDNSYGGNPVSKKRKASKKLQSSKKKRKCTTVSQDIDNDFQTDQNESCHSGGLHRGKSIDEKEKISDVKSKPKKASSPRSAERNNDIVEPLPSSKRFGKLQENGTGCVDVPCTPDGTRKVPSRSARRKKAKRQWVREITRVEKELMASDLQLCQRQFPDMPKNSIEHEEQNQNGDADDEIVPIVIRPGHIRFEPLGKDQAVQQSQVSMETFQWNGITSKQKGQEWGKEKFPSHRRNDYKESNKECSEMMAVEEGKLSNDPIDFDWLAPISSLPKEGDVIAYRLLELSPTWTPGLSSFRVGKTSRCDPKSNRVLLTPVPEYPIIFEKPDEDAWAQQPDNSLYKEDGSLEIDFSALVDVRIVQHGNSDPAKAVTGRVNDGFVCNKVTISAVARSNNYKQKSAVARSNNYKQKSAAARSNNYKQKHVPTPEHKVNAAPIIEENGWSNKNSWHERMISQSLEK